MSCGPWLVIPGVPPDVFAHRLTSGTATVGKSVRCDLQLNHWSLCPTHALFEVSDAGLHVRDLESRQGTYVNERPADGMQAGVGSLVRLGRVVLEVTEAPDAHPVTNSSCPAESTYAADAVGDRAAVEQLSAAQQRVLRHLLRGLPEKAIARQLHVSYHTVHTHVKRIYRELDVHSRSELLSRWAYLAASDVALP